MSLDELITDKKEEKIESVAGKPMGIKEPDSIYNRRKFVDAAEDFFDMEGYYSRLVQNINDSDALKDTRRVALEHMPGDVEVNSQVLSDPHKIFQQAEILYNDGAHRMAKYVERNREGVMGKLSEDHLYQVFLRTQSYKSNDKEYERIRKLKEKDRKIREASQKGEDVGAVIQEELKELIDYIQKNSPEQYQFIMENQNLMIQSLTRGLLKIIQSEFKGLFRDEKGKLDRQKLVDYLDANRKIAENFIDKEIPADKEREREGYWHENLKPYYIELARVLHDPEKKAEKNENDTQERKDRDERKHLARELNMRTP